jgi:5-methylcytosine-specific restriction endonuclease McrA
MYRAAQSTGRVKQAVYWRRALVDYLRDRDGDRCFCRRKMRFDVSTGVNGEDDRGATIDHIIPRSKGGSDDLSNLRLACWECNRRRGNRGGNEQLMLVG